MAADNRRHLQAHTAVAPAARAGRAIVAQIARAEAPPAAAMSKPHIKTEHYRRKNKHSPTYTEWTDTACSECGHRPVHVTARACPGCGAVFSKKHRRRPQ